MERTNPPIPKLSVNLSSDTLFTFTSKLDYMVDMLENGIKPRYIFERIPIPQKTWYYIVAAKCFCDIPLGMIKSHLNWFGNYGLGINKRYLQKLGVSPVIYIHNDSKWIIKALIDNGIKDLDKYPTLPFLKRYFGDDYKLQEDGTYKRHHRKFYDEREWRYIPQKNNISSGSDVSNIKDGLEIVRKKNIEQGYDYSKIKIAPDNVEYLIIDKFTEFKELKSRLRDICQNDDDYELMLSKILIAERIVRDF